MDWYYKFLARRPWYVVLGVGTISLACIIVSFTTKPIPDFSDPTLGFEARGSEIGQRLTAWENLRFETLPSGLLVADPNDLYPIDSKVNLLHRREKNRNRKRKQKKRKKKKKIGFKDAIKPFRNMSFNETDFQDGIIFRDYEANDTIIPRRNHWDYGKNTSYHDDGDAKRIQSKNMWMSLQNFNPPRQNIEVHVTKDGYFCESPTEDYAHFVIERTDVNKTESLFDINTLLAMCHLERRMVEVETYDEFCQKQLLSDSCCRPWSLSNYITLLSNKTSCFELEQDDVTLVRNLLLNCFEYYHNLKLDKDCDQTKCRAPVECTHFNAVFNIFHYLTDINFIKLNDTNIFLKSAMIFLPIGKTTKTLPLYHYFEKIDLKNDVVQVVAMDMGLKDALFDECLLTDSWLIALGGIFVMTLIWLYTSSFFITIMTVLAIIFSLGIAYFIYMVVLEMPFFPFMNLLAVIVVIGIGADDAFIFVKLWQSTLAERLKNVSENPLPVNSYTLSDSSYETLTTLMASTFRHAALSMFVTSLTTAAAFFSSYISTVTSIKCFGIFAGTAVISNYLLMITWLPASVSIMERIPCYFASFFSTTQIYYICGLFLSNQSQKLKMSINKICLAVETCIIRCITSMPIFWVILFGFIGICSGIFVLYWPKLKLPESDDFQLFVYDHPFEMYETKYRHEFWFEKPTAPMENSKLPLRFVWGILPIDNGNYVDPYSRGKLFFDNNFNISSVESQKWLLNFCKKLKKEHFYQTSYGMLLQSCFIENFISWMNRKCIDSMDDVDRTPCCEISKFPFDPYIFDMCLPECTSSLLATPRPFFIPGDAGPRFSRISKDDNTTNAIVKAIVIEFESNVTNTMSYSVIKEYVVTVQKWFDNELLSAPPEMQGGWFISNLDFFNLQDTLPQGTVISIGLAMCLSLLVLLFVTLNILVSLYAVVTISFIILATIAVLIFMNWKLNIIESVSVCTAIGLAGDFTLHYGIHYRLSVNADRDSSTKFALKRMVGPTSMAAFTSAVAGSFMLASNVLPYTQIGKFLVVIMTLSWFYSTFFLMSIFRLIGPQFGFMQFSYPSFKKRHKKSCSGNGKSNEFNDRLQTQTIVSEQFLTPSSSAVGDLMNSASHELDSLTSNSFIKPISVSDCARTIAESDHLFNEKNCNLSHEYRSPSTGSAITVVLPDD